MIAIIRILILSLALLPLSSMSITYDEIVSGDHISQRLLLKTQSEQCIDPAPSNPLDDQLENICEISLQSEVCKAIDEKDLKSCSADDPESKLDPLEMLVGCAEGLFDSVSELLKFIWDVMKFAWSSATDSEFRGKTKAQASAYMDSAKLYLNTEYEKAYEETSFPFREIKAMKKMGGAIASLIMNLVSEAVEDEVEEFGCLNNEARSRYTCKLIGDIFLPPAAVLALIKKGPKAIKSIGTLSVAFSKMKKKVKGGKTGKLPDKKDTIMHDDVSDDLASFDRALRGQSLGIDLENGFNDMRALLSRKPAPTPAELKAVNDQAMAKVKRYFNEQGIPSKVVESNTKPPILEIQVDFSADSNNPLFLKLKEYNRKLGDRKLNISLQRLVEGKAAGAYNAGAKQVTIGVPELAKLVRGESSTTLTHEFRHSMFDQTRDKGKDSVFHGKLVSAKEGVKVSEVKAYQNYISMEELYNHSTDTYDIIKGKTKLNGNDWNAVRRKTSHVENMSDALYANSKEIYEVAESVRNGAKISPDRPFTLVTKEGGEVRFSKDPATDRFRIEVDYNGKTYYEPVVTKAQKEAFEKVVVGFNDYKKTGSAKGFSEVAAPRLYRLMEDIQDKSIKRARISLYQSQWSKKMAEYMDARTPESVDVDILKKGAGILRQGVRENKKGFYDNKLFPHEE